MKGCGKVWCTLGSDGFEGKISQRSTRQSIRGLILRCVETVLAATISANKVLWSRRRILVTIWAGVKCCERLNRLEESKDRWGRGVPEYANSHVVTTPENGRNNYLRPIPEALHPASFKVD